MSHEDVTRFKQVLDAAEKAWRGRDQEAFERASRETPEGYVLCVFNFHEGSPCFSIVAADALCNDPARFRCVEANRLAVPSVPDEQLETNSEPNGSPLETGVPGSVERDHEGDRGNS
jgi:hypothetical protein